MYIHTQRFKCFFNYGAKELHIGDTGLNVPANIEQQGLLRNLVLSQQSPESKATSCHVTKFYSAFLFTQKQVGVIIAKCGCNYLLLINFEGNFS